MPSLSSRRVERQSPTDRRWSPRSGSHIRSRRSRIRTGSSSFCQSCRRGSQQMRRRRLRRNEAPGQTMKSAHSTPASRARGELTASSSKEGDNGPGLEGKPGTSTRIVEQFASPKDAYLGRRWVVEVGMESLGNRPAEENVSDQPHLFQRTCRCHRRSHERRTRGVRVHSLFVLGRDDGTDDTRVVCEQREDGSVFSCTHRTLRTDPQTYIQTGKTPSRHKRAGQDRIRVAVSERTTEKTYDTTMASQDQS